MWKFCARYRFKEYGADRLILYTLTESSEPPLSLQEAASIGDIDTVRILIENGTDVDSLDLGDNMSKSALYRAVLSGHEEIAKFLLLKGADVNFGGRSEPPLHCAARNGQKAMVELLVASGADGHSHQGCISGLDG